jgi:N-acetylneuraminate lyase
MPRLEGIYPALLTPFAEDGSVDLPAYQKLVEFVVAAGVDGVYVGGNIGEWFLLTLEERRNLVRVAAAVCKGRARVLVHAGCSRTSDAVSLARAAEADGADAISSLSPYITRWTEREVLRYLETVATASSLPFLLYYFPALANTGSGLGFLNAVRRLPRIAGAKFTDTGLADLVGLVEAGGEDFSVLNGHDPMLVPALNLGAAGGVGAFYNLIPERFVAAYRACRSGELAKANSIQLEINGIIRAVRAFRLVPALKFACSLRGIQLGPAREPTLDLDAAERAGLEAALRSTTFFDP